MVKRSTKKETEDRRMQALRAELTQEYMRVTKDIMGKFGISGHYSLEFDITLIKDEQPSAGA